ncbi:hypothetical protein WJX72_006818 [[Myrmecia] bisecta]|uniref:Fungal lipase-type domain-containing protein n=1 Tax=[Myrmecia] bisecta TaxID=41462 RepID=A0AAW1Q0N3_9CHLO
MLGLAPHTVDAYKSGNGTIVPGGSISIQEPRTATNVSVAWLRDASTAVIAFQGSQLGPNWLSNFRAWLNRDLLSPVLDVDFPGARVDLSLLDSLLAVTTNAASPEYSILNALNTLNGGALPAHVIVTGHSLGGGLATLGAVWATLQWPEADITSVILGAPQSGNVQWAQAYKELVGNQYRFIYLEDIVPSLPPLDSHAPVGDGTWAPNTDEWLLEDRPRMPFNQYNWDDHPCELYKSALFRVSNVTAPSFITTAAL